MVSWGEVPREARPALPRAPFRPPGRGCPLRPPRVGRRRPSSRPKRPPLEILESFPLRPRDSGAFVAVNVVRTEAGETFPTVALMAPVPGGDPAAVRGIGLEARELRPLALALREADEALEEMDVHSPAPVAVGAGMPPCRCAVCLEERRP